MQECVFCGIASGKVSSYKIWENDDFVAILDIFPKIRGQVVVVSRKHLDSDVLGLPEETVSRFYLAAKEVAGKMKEVYGVERVCPVAEGLEVKHAHIKLFPVWSFDEYAARVGGSVIKTVETELADTARKFWKEG